MSDVCEALSRRDAPALERAAHTLKGSVATFAAKAAQAAALRLEEIGRSGDLAAADAACKSLEAAIDDLTRALRAAAALPEEGRGQP